MKHLLLIIFASFVMLASAGMRVSVLGDSYSSFGSNTTVNRYPCGESANETSVVFVEDMYWMQIIQALGGTLVTNDSYRGTLVCRYTKPNGGKAFIDRMDNLGDAQGDPDLIIVCGGTNDSWDGAGLGGSLGDESCYVPENWTATALKTFRPAFAYLIANLQVKYPGAEILVVINTYDDGKSGIKENIALSIQEIATHYGVMFAQCAGVPKSTSKHPTASGMRSMSRAALAAYCARHPETVLIPPPEPSLLPDDPPVSTEPMVEFDDWISVSADANVTKTDTPYGRAYVFTSPGKVFSVKALCDLKIEQALVVGGGGAGGNVIGGGGGGGGVRLFNTGEFTDSLYCDKSLGVYVGCGGTPGTWGDFSIRTIRPFAGGDGVGSIVTLTDGTQLTALGGGGGGSWSRSIGRNGGNGGGSAGTHYDLPVAGDPPAGTGRDGGFDGGASYCDTASTYLNHSAGGGAGAGEAGSAGVYQQSGEGGEGRVCDITGTDVVYGSGGGGGGGNNAKAASGGTNAGTGMKSANGTAGKDGFGGGGGGGGFTSGDLSGGRGGNGTVVLLLREAAPPFARDTVTVGLGQATLKLANLSFGKDAASASVYLTYALQDQEFPPDQLIAEGVTEGETVEKTLTGLSMGASYSYRFRIVNDQGKACVLNGQFTTLSPGFDVQWENEDFAFSCPADKVTVITNKGDTVYVFSNDTSTVNLFALRKFIVGEALVVGGGGAGGSVIGGGGGGGGVVRVPAQRIAEGMSVALGIGAGGTPVGTEESVLAKNGGDGGDSVLEMSLDGSVLSRYVAGGGGGGASWQSAGDGSAGHADNGSGGGGAGKIASIGNGGAGDGTGHVGGKRAKSSKDSLCYCPGGGGGAGAPGTDADQTTRQAGNGGEGLPFSLTGETVVYGSGGGGGGTPRNGDILSGVGGTNGGDGSRDAAGGNGRDGTGGGGGGGGFASQSPAYRNGGAGGRGTVILRVLAPEKPCGTIVNTGSGLNSLSVRMDVFTVGDGATEAAVYLAYAPEGEEPVDFQLVNAHAKTGASIEWKVSDLQPLSTYVCRMKIVNSLNLEYTVDGTAQTFNPDVDVVWENEDFFFCCSQEDVRVTTNGMNRIYTFLAGATNAVIVAKRDILFGDSLVVGGGGAGGDTIGGGGGGGGVVDVPAFSVSECTYLRIGVGTGGAPALKSDTTTSQDKLDTCGGDGGDSVLIVSNGTAVLSRCVAGGGGGGASWCYRQPQGANGRPTNGSGGGGGGKYNAAAGGAGDGTGGHGGARSYLNDGSKNWCPGGGGGAGENGQDGDATQNQAGRGGEGVTRNITGIEAVYGSGGGGGGGNDVVSAEGGTNAGAGGLKKYSTKDSCIGKNGVDGTGGGGGGGGYDATRAASTFYRGGYGGCGSVILCVRTNPERIAIVDHADGGNGKIRLAFTTVPAISKAWMSDVMANERLQVIFADSAEAFDTGSYESIIPTWDEDATQDDGVFWVRFDVPTETMSNVRYFKLIIRDSCQ